TARSYAITVTVGADLRVRPHPAPHLPMFHPPQNTALLRQPPATTARSYDITVTVGADLCVRPDSVPQ
ncbi:hypothetical protein, partial [Desulfococcus multivorans]|uniref:hypothetical protein n=1 Tax=Desulfococcus multivorans TaxID=897 RepID=UPI001F208B09